MKRKEKKLKVNLRKKKLIILVCLIMGIFLVGMIVFGVMKPFLTSILGAAAIESKTMDLGNYPDMFVSNGTFNGYIVVGEAARAVDSLAMTDIASSMKIMDVVTTTNVSVSGDAWKAQGLEMANSDASAGSIQGESLYDLTRYIGKSELGALADGTYKTGERSYTYTQYLYFDVDNTGTNEVVKYAEDEDSIADVFFFVGSGDNIGQYKLEFSPSAKSNIYNAAGSESSSGTILKSFEDTKINMLGEEFTVVLARRSQANRVKLTLMGGAVSGSLLERETQSYQLNDDSYEVSLNYVDDTSVKFTVNGELTNKLQAGEIYKLTDGKEIGVSEILYQSYAGGIHSADFFVGANKLVLEDSDITDSESDNEMEFNGETIDGAEVIISGTDDNTNFALSTIAINMVAQNDYYVGANDKLSKVIESSGDEPELLFTNNWDIEFMGLSEADSHEIKLDSNSDRRYKFIFYDGKGNKVDLPLFYAVDDNTISFGEEATENCLHLKEGVSIHQGDFFVLTGGDASSGSAASFALQYKGADRSTATNPKIKFKNLGSGNTMEYSVDISSTAVGSAVCDIKLGGYTFSVVNDQEKTGNDFHISISGSDDVDIVDYYGAQISFSNIPASNCRDGGVASSTVTITTPDSGDYDSQAPAEIVLTVGATATNEVTVSSFTIGGTSNPLLGEGNTGYGHTSMGGMISYETPSGSPDSFIYDYPKEQRLPLLYVTSGATTTSSAVSGDLTAVAIVDATRLDKEVVDVTTQNLIVIGGACVNTVAAELLGNPINCSEGFTPGKARIKLFKNDNNIAMLVAGYGSIETRLAGQVITHRWAELSGNEVEIEGTSYSDAVITVIE
ncbi:hypothetical protein GOV03_04035 [Candidatus Woesearchaeota archaeon]|nr:hypothetical protein [Candidatus Woesearchaeota archaeon]